MRAAAVLLALAATAFAGEMRSTEADVIRVAERVRPSVVTVFTPHKKDLDVTGVVIGKGNIILTVRSHLMTQQKTLPETVEVRFPERGKTDLAEVIDDDPESNTVLLRTRKKKGRAIKVGRSADAHLGMWVLLIGNAFGAGKESTPTTSLGIISGLVREHDEVMQIHTSALLNAGSFGAPVVDLTGDLLGIAAPAITGAGGQSVIIPYDVVRERYRAKGSAGAKVVGLRPQPRRLRRDLTDVFGLVVDDAVRRARAALVGVRSGQPVGDAESAAESAPEGLPGSDPNKPAESKRKPPPMPRRVPGRLVGHDRSSGLVVDPKGLVLCPLRVTGWPGPIRTLTVDLRDGTELPATLLGRDERLRLALLSVHHEGLTALEPASGDSLRSGRIAIALGFPHGYPIRQTPQVTVGIVSRTAALGSLHPAFRAVQTDAGIAGGNRGGPLVDIDGKLIGVILDVNESNPRGYHLKIQGDIAGNCGLGFAVPAEVLRELVPKLEEGAILRPGFLGVGTREAEEGLLVTNVSEKNSKGEPSAAKKAGINPGDRFVKVGGESIRGQADLTRVLGGYCAGDEVELVLEREGRRLTVKVVLTER
jgi:S1-C subfamily serine protease